jgi:uncharacterized protein YqeY
MALIDDINKQLKQSMLARDEFVTTVLRGLKSAILYEEVAKNKRDEGLTHDKTEKVIAREVKKRDDAIEMYVSAGDQERAERETAERKILMAFLPEPLGDNELRAIIERVITAGGFGPKDMGRVIGNVKQEVGTRGDGAKIAAIVKEILK